MAAFYSNHDRFKEAEALYRAQATAELEHGKLSQAHEALLAARHTYEQLVAQIAGWSGKKAGDQPAFMLQLAQADQAIARSERRLAAHVSMT
jgi:hypothetical protein